MARDRNTTEKYALSRVTDRNIEGKHHEEQESQDKQSHEQ
jgi:hypothetical protein